MGDKTEKINKKINKHLKEIQEIINDDKTDKGIYLSDFDIRQIRYFISAILYNDETKIGELIYYLQNKLPDTDKERRINTIADIRARRIIKSAQENSISRRREAEYKMFCIEKVYVDTDDTKRYCKNFLDSIDRLIELSYDIKQEAFRNISRKLTDCQEDFKEWYDGRKDNLTSEKAVKACFRCVNETIFESIVPVIYTHIYDDYEEDKDIYIEFLGELNKFFQSVGIFTCNEYASDGGSLIGERIDSLGDEQRNFYVIVPLALSEPEKNGIITAVEQLPYVTCYRTEDGNIKRMIEKCRLIVIKSN